MKFKGIIFDLDGVICSTDQYHYLAWKVIADKLNIYFDESINHRLRGVSRMESLEIILENGNRQLEITEKVLYAEEKNSVYRKLLENITPKDLSDEVYETLKKIKSNGIKVAIGSSSKNAVYILERLGLHNFFDAVSDGNQITNSKPDPEVFLKAATLIDCFPCECLVVEDALAGVQAAKSGYMKCAAIGDATKSMLADYQLDTFSDLISILDIQY